MQFLYIMFLNEYLPLKQGLRLNLVKVNVLPKSSMSIFH